MLCLALRRECLNKGGVMSQTYLKVILSSAVGGLYLIAYSLFYLGSSVSGVGAALSYMQ